MESRVRSPHEERHHWKPKNKGPKRVEREGGSPGFRLNKSSKKDTWGKFHKAVLRYEEVVRRGERRSRNTEKEE